MRSSLKEQAFEDHVDFLLRVVVCNIPKFSEFWNVNKLNKLMFCLLEVFEFLWDLKLLEFNLNIKMRGNKMNFPNIHCWSFEI